MNDVNKARGRARGKEVAGEFGGLEPLNLGRPAVLSSDDMIDDLHRRAMDLVEDAEQLFREGQREAAREKYEEAARLEQECADNVGEDQPRARGILRGSAVSAWRMARIPERAAALARRYLTEPTSPGFSRELHELLNQIERERAEDSANLPREPEARAEALLEELRGVEADLSRGRVRLTPIHVGRAA